MSEAARYSGLPDVGISHDDRQAQERFIQENLRRIFLQIYRIVGNVDDAQDLAALWALGYDGATGPALATIAGR